MVNEGDIETKVSPTECRALVITSQLDDKQPWWWRHIEKSPLAGRIDHKRILLRGGRITGVLSRRFFAFASKLWGIVRRARTTHTFIFTVECGWESLLVSLIQTLTGIHQPRHVILQFIMREKAQTLASRFKYVFMRWLFSSVYLCVCSSRGEGRYYESVFGWSSSKWSYVPFHTDPALFDYDCSGHDGFVLSAGRTFRDYRTLLQGFQKIGVPLRIVASPQNINIGLRDKLDHITIDYDMLPPVLMKLMARAFAVVVPLEPRKISVGQSVLVYAMTLGKPVIATRVNGTEDCIEHMKTGILVPPQDPCVIEEAVRLLLNDEPLRQQLGRAARERIKEAHLPIHCLHNVARALGVAT
jgi:glycosyltransferase involved in cell wall biosynthesis